ncbi:metalloproteinase inhibitor 3-like [Asterias amurensis]|uniref:metalloproteinase inhibitor 3-like n=1 Tax=Asterias amurensis TaxID=7602 RepID=UPI003AB2AE48
MEVLTKVSLILMLVMPLVSGQQEQEPSSEPPRPASQCNCPIRHPQENICRADIVIQGRIMEVKSPGDGLLSTVALLEYSVKVNKVFKDTEGVLNRKRRRKIAMITSSSDRLCGVTEMKTGALYLMTGLAIGGELFFSQCEWVHRYKELSPDQKAGLKQEFLRGCDSCQIDQQGSSIPGIHNDTASETVCYHDPLGSEQLGIEDCETEYSICKPVKKGHCAWTGGQRYKSCVEKRINKFNEAKQVALLAKGGKGQ